MELFPRLEVGWLNGWVLLVVYGSVFGGVVRSFSKDVVARLYDRSGWTRTQKIVTTLGRLVSLAMLVLLVFTPLKIGRAVFVAGTALFALGLFGVVVALVNFSNTPPNQPVAKGLYRVSRNPQWVMLVLTFLGACIATGSGIALILLLVAVVCYHFRILGEERSCLALYGESYQRYMENVPRYLLLV